MPTADPTSIKLNDHIVILNKELPTEIAAQQALYDAAKYDLGVATQVYDSAKERLEALKNVKSAFDTLPELKPIVIDEATQRAMAAQEQQAQELGKGWPIG